MGNSWIRILDKKMKYFLHNLSIDEVKDVVASKKINYYGTVFVREKKK
ncbi:MAG: hypothetical protein LBS55_09525 [Prevotellaceae bacterium]|jgi:hypothetical protein|nr:hypothetical protein [Prevotellaceae bacterium]